MKPLFGLLLLHLSFASKIYVRLHNNLHITSKTEPNANYFWAKRRSWSTGYDQIAGHLNCSIKAAVRPRILECGENLTIANVSNEDEGEYRLRRRFNKSTMDFQYFQVNVYDLYPVLMPTLIHRVKIHFWCGDLKNKHAVSSIEIRAVKNEYNARLVKLSDHYWYVIIDNLVNDRYAMGTQYLFRTELRCCSAFSNDFACGPWTFVGHHMYLSTKKNRGRPWCSYRGQHHLAGVSFDYNHDGPLFEPTCSMSAIAATNATVCEGTKLVIYDIKNKLKRYRRFGGVRLISTGTEYTFTPKLEDSGLYFDDIKHFAITVKPKLYVALQAVRIHDNFIELKCAHTGNEKAGISWYIEGKYSSYKIVNENIIIYQDCWLDWDFWYYEFGVNCKVTDGPMQSYSRWLMGKVKRTNMLDNSLFA